MDKCGAVEWLLLAALYLTTLADAATKVPEFRRDYEYVASQSAFYKPHFNAVPWAEAVRICASEDSELATPQSLAETNLILRILKTVTRSVVWVGAHDHFNEGVFTAIDGNTDVFLNWAKSEPNNLNNEDCVAIFGSGEFYDYFCTAEFYFACKKKHQLKKRFTVSLNNNNNEEPYFRSDYTFSPFDGAFFKVHKRKLKWTDAMSKCVEEGSQLLTIATKSDASSAVKKIGQNEIVWIGIHDIFEKNHLITIDGRPISDTYIDWDVDEPKTTFSGTCVTLFPGGHNRVDDCLERHEFICKKDLSSLTNTFQECETYDQEYFYSEEIDECYKVHTVPKTWFDAHKICKSEEAILAIINTEEEARVLVEAWRMYPVSSLQGQFDKNNVHLGYNDLITQGVFLTTEGKTLHEAGYDNWRADQPDNKEGIEHCGGMFRDGKLNDFNCQILSMFFCEKKLGDVIQAPLERPEQPGSEAL